MSDSGIRIKTSQAPVYKARIAATTSAGEPVLFMQNGTVMGLPLVSTTAGDALPLRIYDGATVKAFQEHLDMTTIDFDDDGDYPTEIGSYYNGQPGAPVFDSDMMFLYFGSRVNPYGPHSLYTMMIVDSVNPVSINFSTPIRRVSLQYGVGVDKTLVVKGYLSSVEKYSSGTLTETTGDDDMVLLTFDDVIIDEIEFNGTPQYYTMDDLQYGVIDV